MSECINNHKGMAGNYCHDCREELSTYRGVSDPYCPKNHTLSKTWGYKFCSGCGTPLI